MTNIEEPRIEDFVDLSVLQRLQDSFAQAMGVAAVTVDREGKPVTAVSNFCRVCLMIRETGPGLARCQRCDAEGGRLARRKQAPFAYKCAGGFLDAAAPIIIDGQYLGCILCGQVIPSDSAEEFIQDILARNVPLGIDADQLEKEVRAMTPLPRDRFQAAVEMLSLTANNIIANGATNVAQARLLRESQERAALQAALQEAQLIALKAQINPHFLFNSLTLIGYTSVSGDPASTEEIVYNLSDLLRYSLRNVSTSVELSEEIDMVERYLTIQKIGFGERLRSEIDVDPELRRTQIPCMLLQPLVENAVLHGAEPMKRPVTITLRARQQGDFLLIEVADDGAGMSPEQVQAINNGQFASRKQSVGLRNVYERLRGEYGESCRFEVESALGTGTTFRLFISMTQPLSGHAEALADRPSGAAAAPANGTRPTLLPDNRPLPFQADLADSILTPIQ